MGAWGHDILYGVLVPAVVVAGALLLALPFRKGAGDGVLHAAGGLGLSGAFFAGNALLKELAPLEPADAWHWLPYLAFLAVAVGLLDLLPGIPSAVRWDLWLIVAAVAALLLIPNYPAFEATRPRWQAGMGAAVYLLWTVLDPVTRRRPGPLVPFLLFLITAGGAAVILSAGFMKLTQLAGMVAAVLGAGTVLALWRRDRPLLTGAVPAVAVLLPGLMFNARFETFSEVPLVSFLLIVAAPLVLGLSLLPSFHQLPNRWQAVLLIVAVLALVGTAAGLAAVASPPATEEDWSYRMVDRHRFAA